MPQSLSKIYLHIIFSTKERKPLITERIEPVLYAYMSSTVNQTGNFTLCIGGTSDHIHLLCILSKTMTASKLVEEVKKSSSKWIKTKGSEFSDFSWQAGYGVFSVSQSQVDIVKEYIQKQKTHHAKVDFKEEFLKFIEKYQIEFDERYLWG